MEGYWINIESGKYEEVFEHASWIHDQANQKLIGLPEDIGRQIMFLPPSDFKGKSRKDIIMLATQGGLIRARRYGHAISFEFQIKGINKKVMNTIYQFLINTDIPADYTQITLNNLATNESIATLWKDFSKRMKQGEAEEILRLSEKAGKR